MRRLASAIVVGVVVGLVGYWIGAQLDTANNGDAAILLGFADGVLLWLRGWRSATNVNRTEGKGWTEYFGISLDHKVVGMQFAVGIVLIAVVLVLVRIL